MIGTIVAFIGLAAVGAFVYCYVTGIEEVKKAGYIKHDYNYIENTDDTEDEDDE